MNCEECKERMYPEDPSQPFYLPYPESRYLRPICESCPNYGIEIQPLEQIVIHRQSNMSKQEYDLLQQTALKADYLLKRVTEKQPSFKKKGRLYNNYV